jgi:mono/diheme cytochrome c family protein
MKRGSFLMTVAMVAVVMVACGRADEMDINQALGITPTPTPSAEDLATREAIATATSEARSAAATNAGEGSQAEALGDISRGSMQFTTQCTGCHRPGGNSPDILAPGSAGADASFDTLLPLIREGEGHPVPPGPYSTTELSENAIRDIAAFIASRAGS